MRRNSFGEAYCVNSEELAAEIDSAGWFTSGVYADRVRVADGETPAWEVLENESGDTICYVEADTDAACQQILRDVGVEIVT